MLQVGGAAYQANMRGESLAREAASSTAYLPPHRAEQDHVLLQTIPNIEMVYFISKRWWTTTEATLAIFVALPFASCSTNSTTLEPLAPTPSSQDMYGIGNRLGSYFQALAFLLGFANVTRLDPKSQFAGVILSFQLLVRWWSHKDHNSTNTISTPELWIGLAQLLLFTGPGCLLLYLSFSTQRHKWDDEQGHMMLRKDAVRGQGLNFLQMAVIVVWVNVTNSVFSYWIVATKKGEGYPDVNKPENPIWMFTTKAAGSTWIKWFMVVQAICLTVFELGPLVLYTAAWIESVRDYWGQKKHNGQRRQRYAGMNGRRAEWTEFGLPRVLQGRSNWLSLFCGSLSTFYVVMLVISIEKTIASAGLRSAMDASTPGQLLPLITGSVALVTAIANVGRPVTRVERFYGGGKTYHQA